MCWYIATSAADLQSTWKELFIYEQSAYIVFFVVGVYRIDLLFLNLKRQVFNNIHANLEWTEFN